MPSKITMVKIENIIAAAQTAGVTDSKNVIRGKILSVKMIYSHTTPASSSDRDINIFEMNPVDPDAVAKALQEVLNIGNLGAVPADDNAVYYPETNAQDNTGADLDLSDAQGGNVAKFTPFLIFGRLRLAVTAAAAGDITTAYIMVEEY